MVYAVPIVPFNIRKPDYDFFGPIAEGLESVRKRRLEDEALATKKDVGRLVSGNDLRGASSRALNAGDLRTGMDLRRAEQNEQDRAIDTQNQAHDRDEKARRYVSNVLMKLDPAAPDFGAQWKTHLGRMRNAGYNIPAEYDDPKTGYDAVSMEVGGGPERQPRVAQANSPLATARETIADAETPGAMKVGQGLARDFGGDGQPVVGGSGDENALGGDSAPKADEIAKHTELEGKLGKAKRGFIWALDENGSPYQKSMARNEKPKDPSMDRAIGALTDRLDAAEKVLKNSSYLSNYAGETMGYGDAGRAYEDFESAALGVVYAMSGKQTTNKEMERFLRINKPQWNDRTETIGVRTGRVKAVLRAITGGIKSGKSYDEAERDALAGVDTLQDEAKPAATSYEGMSDEELLRELNR